MNHEHESPGRERNQEPGPGGWAAPGASRAPGTHTPAEGAERRRWARGPAGHDPGSGRYPYQWQAPGTGGRNPEQQGADEGTDGHRDADRSGEQDPGGARDRWAAAPRHFLYPQRPEPARSADGPSWPGQTSRQGQEAPATGRNSTPGQSAWSARDAGVAQGTGQDPWAGQDPYAAGGPRQAPQQQPRQWWSGEDNQPFTSENGRHLSPRSMVVGPLNQLRSLLLPILIGLVVGGFNPWLLAATGATVVALLVGGFITWQTLRYEITDDRIEIRKGLIRRERRTIPLVRIRGVDVTSSLLHRMLGVSVVNIEAAAGSGAGEDGKLDAVETAEADRLRGELLRRRAILTESGAPGTEPGQSADGQGKGAEPETVTYFEMPRPWYLFGALSLAHLLTPFALLATVLGVLQQSTAHMEGLTGTVVGVIDSTDRALLMTMAVAVPVVLVLLMPVFAVVSYAVANWGFTLKDRDGSLVAERGLFTRRSVTLEKRRIRGYELQDNPLERTRDAVRLRAIVTGLGDAATRAVLLPTGPRPRVGRIVERALARYDGGLLRHPRAALYRRLIRSVVPFLITGVLGVVLGWNWLMAASAVLAALGLPLGIDRYRSLGHGYDGAYVSVRSGSLQRGQAVVERSAVIGWHWNQTLFQRRSGLSDLQVTVGAGAGGYTAQDASLAGSVAFAARVTPEMVRPFLVGAGEATEPGGVESAGGAGTVGVEPEHSAESGTSTEPVDGDTEPDDGVGPAGGTEHGGTERGEDAEPGGGAPATGEGR